MSFWDNVFSGGQSQQQPITPGPTLGQPRAWWQDEPQQVYNNAPVIEQQGYQQQPVPQQQDLRKIRKRGHQNISAEEAEAIAEYDLSHNAKYQNRCPECDSGNFILSGTRGVGAVATTDKCFDCGYTSRGLNPERAVGGGSGTGSIHTRQIDTGGGGGSMFMKFNGVPRSYAPRA